MCKISWLRKGFFCWVTMGAVLGIGSQQALVTASGSDQCAPCAP